MCLWVNSDRNCRHPSFSRCKAAKYLYNNPVHPGFCTHPMEYPWSNYLTCISVKPTKLCRDSVIGWFDDKANFKYMHDQKVEVEQIEHWLKV